MKWLCSDILTDCSNLPKGTFIYVIRNIKNGKRYIGSTLNFRGRWRHHCKLLKEGKHHSNHLQAAWSKYGPTAFELVLLRKAPLEKNQRRDLEGTFIEKFDSRNPQFGYNEASSANGGHATGYKPTRRTVEKIRLANIERLKNPAEREKMRIAAKQFWEGNDAAKNKQREKALKAYQEHPELKRQQGVRMEKLFSDPRRREKARRKNLEAWKRPDTKKVFVFGRIKRSLKEKFGEEILAKFEQLDEKALETVYEIYNSVPSKAPPGVTPTQFDNLRKEKYGKIVSYLGAE